MRLAQMTQDFNMDERVGINFKWADKIQKLI